MYQRGENANSEIDVNSYGLVYLRHSDDLFDVAHDLPRKCSGNKNVRTARPPLAFSPSKLVP